MKLKLIILLCSICFPIAVYPLPANAASITEQVKTIVDEVVRIVSDKEMKKPGNEQKRRTALKATIGRIFDYGEMARRSMGSHWKGLTPAQKKEFVGLFSTLLENSYAGKIESYNQEKILYGKESQDGNYAVVTSRIISTKGNQYAVDYRLLRESTGWMIYDVVIEGVSLVSNYRSQFNRIINEQGYDELVKKLRTKSEEITAP